VALRFVGKTTKKESITFRVREGTRRRKNNCVPQTGNGRKIFERFSRPHIFFFSAN
jgi:hypothetical protein